MQVRKTKRKRNYYICENNPKSCDYISWNKPKVGEKFVPNNEIDIETGQMNIKGNVKIDGDLNIKNGVSGSFITLGNFVTVENGIIVSIE